MQWIKASNESKPIGVENQRLSIKFKGLAEVLLFLQGKWVWFESNSVSFLGVAGSGRVPRGRYDNVKDESWAEIEYLYETPEMDQSANAMKQEFSLALYWLTKCFEGKSLSEKEKKRVDRANYVINKYANILDALRSNESETPATPVSVEEAAKKYADSKADLKWNKASELEAAFLAGHAHRGPTVTVDIDKLVAPLISCLKSIANNYDCDTDAHKYNTICRCCDAKETLSWWEVEKPKQNHVTVDIVEALEKANPYPEGEEDLPWHFTARVSWGNCCAKLRELIASRNTVNIAGQ